MENENLNVLIEKYKLPKNEHRAILIELQKRVFLNTNPRNNPSVIFVIGQPGCGKTTYIQKADLSSYTIINSDEYRSLNKHSNEILDKYPTYYTKLTNFDAHLWGDELFSYAMSNKYSALREKAPVDNSLLETIKTIPTEFDTIVNLVVAGNLESLIATRERYEKEILQSNNARLSNIEAHNKCYNLLPNFISNCLNLGVQVNYVVRRNDEYEIVSAQNDALNLLQRYRNESNEHACIEYETRINNIKKAMISRNAPQEQFDELDKIERIYREILNVKKSSNIEHPNLGDER